MALIEFFSALNVFDFVFDQYLFMYGKFCCHSAVNSSPRERVIFGRQFSSAVALAILAYQSSTSQ